jgi:hypothetical protein
MAVLRRSRYVRRMEEPGLYDCRRIERDHEAWLADLLDHFDYATKREALERLAYCYLRARPGQISIEPTHHDRIEGWNGMLPEYGAPCQSWPAPNSRTPAFDRCV